MALLPLSNQSKKIKRWLTFLLIPIFLVGLIIAQPQTSFAASGGRIGGGSFRAPSIPRSGGYRGGYPGGYGGYGGYRGGGIGFPFLIPFFGFGGGGLFGFLVLMSIVGVIINAVRGSSSGQRPLISDYGITAQNQLGPVTISQLQLGLLAKAKEVQKDLRELASTADTASPLGLQRVLQDTTLALLRQPDLWVYANLENGQVPFNSAETTFNRLSLTERSKLKEEITINVSGNLNSNNSSTKKPGDADVGNEYIAVTVLIASKQNLNLKKCSTEQDLKEALRIIGSISSNDLMAIEVIWQPEGIGEVLTSGDLLTTYPNLQHL